MAKTMFNTKCVCVIHHNKIHYNCTYICRSIYMYNCIVFYFDVSAIFLDTLNSLSLYQYSELKLRMWQDGYCSSKHEKLALDMDLWINTYTVLPAALVVALL